MHLLPLAEDCSIPCSPHDLADEFHAFALAGLMWELGAELGALLLFAEVGKGRAECWGGAMSSLIVFWNYH